MHLKQGCCQWYLMISRGYDGNLLAGVLPVALFASGHTFYVQNLAARMGLEPYVAHNTFQFAGTEGKRHRFRERSIWLAVSSFDHLIPHMSFITAG